MKTQVDNIPKEQRPYFKAEVIKALEGKANVYFSGDKAIVETKEPYFATDESLSEKSRLKKALINLLAEFRVYQFNNN